MKTAKSFLLRVLAALGLETSARALWKRAKYFGTRHECPICHAHIRTFLPGGQHFAVLAEKSIIGGGYRDNMYCPVCGATDRDRLIYLFLKNRPQLLASGTKLLHVAPETKFGGWLKGNPDLDYASADIDMEGVDYAVDLTKIQFSDASYGAVICNHVLEHIPDDAKAMSEIFRILKPNGWAILQTPVSASLAATYEDFSITDPKERERAFGQCDHVRIYAMDYVDRLKRAGFEVEPFRWAENSAGYGGERNRFGLNEREIVFFVSRPQNAVHGQVTGGIGPDSSSGPLVAESASRAEA